MEATDSTSMLPEMGRVRKSKGIAVGHEGPHQVDLDLIAQDDAEDQRGERKTELDQQVADDAEEQQRIDVGHDVVERVRADHAEDEDLGIRTALGTRTTRRYTWARSHWSAIMTG